MCLQFVQHILFNMGIATFDSRRELSQSFTVERMRSVELTKMRLNRDVDDG